MSLFLIHQWLNFSILTLSFRHFRWGKRKREGSSSKISFIITPNEGLMWAQFCLNNKLLIAGPLKGCKKPFGNNKCTIGYFPSQTNLWSFSSWMSVFTADFSTIQALLFAKYLHRFRCWFEWLEVQFQKHSWRTSSLHGRA